MSNSKDHYYFSERIDNSHRKNITMSTSDPKMTYKSARTNLTLPEDCLFCGDEFQKSQKQRFSQMVTKALYAKYSSSQNYYYTKDVNEILGESRTSAVISFKDYLHYDEQEEYLKRFYFISEYDFKIKMLTEYYKFHNDVARIFVMPVTNILNKFHDKKRRLEYIRVTKMLKMEQDDPEKESTPGLDKKNIAITDRILDDLDLTDPDSKKQKRGSTSKGSQPYLGKPSSSQDLKTGPRKSLTNKNQTTKGANEPVPSRNSQQIKDVSMSNTLHDLNAKLGEIISNSISDTNYFENSVTQANETISNLTDFLKFMNKQPQNSQNPKTPEIPSADYNRAKPKLVTSGPLTDRPYRPESSSGNTKARHTPKADLLSRPSDLMVKLISPQVTKTSAKTFKSTDKTSEHYEDKIPTSSGLSRYQNSQPNTGRSKGSTLVTKIKNFEEAIKINMQSASHKLAIHASLPRESTQDKILSANTSKTNRGSISRTPSKHIEERSHESSISKQRSQQYSSATTRANSRTKTKSTDTYTKALDLLLGTNQAMLSSGIQKRNLAAQPHRSTKSSFTFKLKTPSHAAYSGNERSSEIRPDSANKYPSKSSSNKLASERGHLHTDRELKKVSTIGNFDLQKKDFIQIPLSDRDLPKDYGHRNKELIKADNKGMIKSVVPITGETDSYKVGLIGYTDQKKGGYHKYTKSEGRIKKIDDKIEVFNSAKVLLNGNNRSKQPTGSPKRQSYIYNHNNIVNVFLNSNQERKFDRTVTLKSERQRHQEAQLNSNSDSISKAFKSRSPNSEMVAKFNQSLPKKLTSQDFDYKNLDFSPSKISQKDTASTNHPRVMSERSPPSVSIGLHRRNHGKSEYETFKREFKLDNFDSHVKSKEKL